MARFFDDPPRLNPSSTSANATSGSSLAAFGRVWLWLIRRPATGWLQCHRRHGVRYPFGMLASALCGVVFMSPVPRGHFSLQSTANRQTPLRLDPCRRSPLTASTPAWRNAGLLAQGEHGIQAELAPCGDPLGGSLGHHLGQARAVIDDAGAAVPNRSSCNSCGRAGSCGDCRGLVAASWFVNSACVQPI